MGGSVDVSITRDGRRLDSKEAVLAWLADVEADRAAGVDTWAFPVVTMLSYSKPAGLQARIASISP